MARGVSRQSSVHCRFKSHIKPRSFATAERQSAKATVSMARPTITPTLVKTINRIVAYRAQVFFDGNTFERTFWNRDRANRFAIYTSSLLSADRYTIRAIARDSFTNV
jgi:hypothetical protein